MVWFDLGCILEIGDRASDPNDFVVCPGRQPHFGDGSSHAMGLDFSEGTPLSQFAATHLRVGQRFGVGESNALNFASRGDLFANLCAARSGRSIGEFFEGNRWDFDVDIHSVEQWST